MKNGLLLRSLRYGVGILCSRRIYMVCLVVIPIAFTLFFINMMDEGVAMKVPSGVVDLDHSQLSRRVSRTLSSSELVDVTEHLESFHEAVTAVRTGRIFGFFMIPADFQQKAIAGKKPTITYYCNMTYFVPGTMIFKGFKTVAVTTKGGLVQTTLVGSGINESTASTLIQPVAVQQQAIGNPWMNYNYYLTNSFVPGIICLMVALVTSFSICEEIKTGSSRRWMDSSGGSILVALFGKLAPQTVVEVAVGVACQALMFKFNHFPLNCPAWHMVLAMVLMVIASQAFAVIVCCILPNLRLAVSICSLLSILAFSIAAFSFPVEQMYPAVGIFSYILPVRYYFLIYADQALNGIPLYYSRYFYIALLLFPLVAMAGLWRLKKRCLNPVYVP
ncbi:MAG: ABC transporter permease [Bacteroides sp.]|nr:ABC transporter permease [Bacteroides sp.]MCM1413510.1 ABC transporter permease [Bacteroides sp.]MCM1471064.1 ABC transporter permease [Bacteroides sp.]